MTAQQMDEALLTFADECRKAADVLIAILPTSTYAIGTLLCQSKDLERQYRERHEKQLELLPL